MTLTLAMSSSSLFLPTDTCQKTIARGQWVSHATRSFFQLIAPTPEEARARAVMNSYRLTINTGIDYIPSVQIQK
jgi:hypothetical protein